MDDAALIRLLAWALVLLFGFGVPGAIAFGIWLGKERMK